MQCVILFIKGIEIKSTEHINTKYVVDRVKHHEVETDLTLCLHLELHRLLDYEYKVKKDIEVSNIGYYKRY